MIAQAKTVGSVAHRWGPSMHFHYTRWKVVDDQHLVQDWFIVGGKTPVSQAHLEFVRRAEGETAPAPAGSG